MTSPDDNARHQFRWSVYVLLMTLSAGAMLGRIAAVDSVDRIALEDFRIRQVEERLDRQRAKLRQQGLEGAALEQALGQFARQQRLWEWALLRRPFLSANDRSRWCTVRALVEPDMRVPGHPYAIDKVLQESNWDTIDMVKHGGHLYSSKPPLLPTLLAGEYWVIRKLSGLGGAPPASLGTEPYWVGRLMLVATNVIPLLVYFLLIAGLIERLGTSDWGRVFVMGAAAFGTFLTTFAVTINNHLPAAVCAAATLYLVVRIWLDGQRHWGCFALAGLMAALTAANELPALALFAAVSLALLWKAPRQTLLAYVPAVLLVAGGFFGTNWIAHHSLKPPYMHRSPDDNWYDYTYVRNGKEYQSYWRNPVGVDRGEPSRAKYALHVLVGHHGVFSLTPVWLLSMAGAGMWLAKGRDRRLRELALLVLLLTLVCLAFYLCRPPADRNYGGVTSGFRWMFWFAPLWLVVMLPAADAMARRSWTRLVALLLLAVSVLSASYPTWNPWTAPWIMDYLEYLGWPV